MMFTECPYCLTNVIKKSDGTCPQCLNNLDKQPPEEIILRNKKLKEENGSQIDPYEEINKFQDTFVIKKLVPSLLICIAGVVFSFVLKTGFIWIGAIIGGGIYFIFNLIRYFSKVAELKIEISQKMKNKEQVK